MPTPKKKVDLPTVPSKVTQEIKRTIAAHCLSLFTHRDLKKVAQEEEMFKLFHGGGERVSQVECFLGGRGVFDNVFINEASPQGNVTVLPEILHCHPTKRIVKGENLTRFILSNTYPNKVGLLTGRTLRNHADDAAKGARKLMSIMPEAVKAGIIKKVGEDYVWIWKERGQSD